jgi:antitoxin (DNA-binding transcriptional repressor) of toxin-antitoxin stability system
MISKTITKMESFTVEEFQLHFDELLERVENGESFLIRSEYGNAIMVPYDNQKDNDENVRCFYDHDDAS